MILLSTGLPGVEAYDEGEWGGEVVAHAHRTEGDVRTLPREGEDDLHHRLRHRRQHVRPARNTQQNVNAN